MEEVREAALAGRALLARSLAEEGKGNDAPGHNELYGASQRCYNALNSAGYRLGNNEWMRGPRYGVDRVAQLKSTPIVPVTEADALHYQAFEIACDLTDRRHSLNLELRPPDFGIEFLCEENESLSIPQLRAICESSEIRRDDRSMMAREELQKRLGVAEQLNYLRAVDAGEVELPDGYVHETVVEKFRDILLQTLIERLPVAVDEDLRTTIEVAEEYLYAQTHPDFRRFDESAVDYEERYEEARSCYVPSFVQDLLELKNLVTRASARYKPVPVEGQGEARRRAERQAAGLPFELPFERPTEHICPISLQRMIEPVIAADGRTYERTAIQEWFFRGRLDSPCTREQMPHRELVPNHALRVLIRDWAQVEHDKLLLAQQRPGWWQRAWNWATSSSRKRRREEM